MPRGGGIIRQLSVQQATLLCYARYVPRAMKHADDNQFCFSGRIVNCVFPVKRHPHPLRESIPRRPGKRKIEQMREGRLNSAEQALRGRFRGFESDIGPDFCKIGFRRVGQAEAERAANSILPRATMPPASKSLTRPAATSAKPLSISNFSAASS